MLEESWRGETSNVKELLKDGRWLEEVLTAEESALGEIRYLYEID